MNSWTTAPPLAADVIGSSQNDFVIAEWRDSGSPPGTPRFIAPLHVHYNDDEAWYVLEGRLVVRVGDDEVEARAGSAVFVPRGTPHTYWNPDPSPVRYLLVMTANIYALIQEIHHLKDRSTLALGELFRKHDSELL